eukprot:5434643-Alexandrium_andersonii.AAC.1
MCIRDRRSSDWGCSTRPSRSSRGGHPHTMARSAGAHPQRHSPGSQGRSQSPPNKEHEIPR